MSPRAGRLAQPLELVTQRTKVVSPAPVGVREEEGRHSQREVAVYGTRDARGWRRALTWRRASEVPAVRVHRLQEEVAHGQDDGGLQPRAPHQAPRCAHSRPGPRGHQQGELQPQQRGPRDADHGRRLTARPAGEGPERRAPGDTRGRASAWSRPARALCASRRRQGAGVHRPQASLH